MGETGAYIQRHGHIHRQIRNKINSINLATQPARVFSLGMVVFSECLIILSKEESEDFHAPTLFKGLVFPTHSRDQEKQKTRGDQVPRLGVRCGEEISRAAKSLFELRGTKTNRAKQN